MLSAKTVTALAVALCAVAIVMELPVSRPAHAQTFTEFRIPTAKSQPGYMTLGADGALWFTEIAGNKIGRITTTGEISEFSIPTPKSQPYSIAAGPDGNLWFVEFTGNKIGRITPSGTITEFEIPTADSQPVAISPGPDNAMWFAGLRTGAIGRITLDGAITEFPPVIPVSKRARARDHDRTGRQSLGHGVRPSWLPDAVNMIARITPERNDHRIPGANPQLLAGRRDFGWPRRRAVVCRGRQQQDRPHHDRWQDHRIPAADAEQPAPGLYARSRRRIVVHAASRSHRPDHDERRDYRVYRSDRKGLALRHRHRT